MTLPTRVSGRSADTRLLLPRLYTSAQVLPGARHPWSEALSATGVAVADAADLVVGGEGDLAQALGTNAESLLLMGAPDGRSLARAGYSVHRHLVVAGRDGPRLLVPLQQAALKKVRAIWLTRTKTKPTTKQQRRDATA